MLAMRKKSICLTIIVLQIKGLHMKHQIEFAVDNESI